ncbi:MAG: ice-binding family protein, partial [Pseudomonadota bacterium]
TEWDRAEADPGGNIHMSGFSFDPRAWVRTLRAKLAGFGGAVAALGLMVIASTSPSHAQPPPLGTNLPTFGVLGASTVTNTGPTTISGTAARPGNLGVSPGNAFTDTGAVTFATGGVTHLGDAFAAQAQVELTAAYTNLAGRPAAINLTGQDLGGLVLVPGVYNFSSSAQLTGNVTLNGLGNPNSIFIFQIGSTLTTASASSVTLINGAQGGNVFWQVGSSATLGTTTSFTGNILAQASITLNTGATITCGAAWARTGAVTMDANTITLCDLITAPVGPAVPLGPTGFPLFAFLLPSSANDSQRAVANAIDAFVAGGGTLPLAFLDLFRLSPSELADAFSQLQGEAGTGAAQAGTQAMNSFLSLLTSPFGDNRGFAPESPLRPPLITKAPVYKAAPGPAPDPRRWGIWAAGYGGYGKAVGDPLVVGSHDRSVRTYGYATGLDYRITPYTVAGFALAGGGTNYGLADGFGGGRSHMFQAAAYTSTRFNGAYVSTAVAYAWHRVSTDRFLTVAGTDHLTADFSAHNVGGRIEGGYRFAIPDVLGLPGRHGFTPYAAAQVQIFRTPTYSEIAASGSSIFALTYNERKTTTTRGELGAWFDWSMTVDHDTAVVLRTRAAWAHDHWSDPSIIASFQALPGSFFTETGAAPARDLLLVSAGGEVLFRNGFSLAAWFDGEFAEHWQKYAGTARLRYIW